MNDVQILLAGGCYQSDNMDGNRAIIFNGTSIKLINPD